MKNLTVNKNITIKEAMEVLEKTSEKCIIVINKNGELLGTLTDGDLRRDILRGRLFGESIETSYNPNPKFIKKEDFNFDIAKKILIENKLDLIPIVDSKNIVIDYATDSKKEENKTKTASLKDVPVVIMAGGRGTRLEPFTNVLPKPLVPIKGKPIIEHIIENFFNTGYNNFYLSVNYKSKIIKAYFEEVDSDYNINFIDEKKPLGTAGSLKYLQKDFKTPFFVTNCDILVQENYNKIFQFHKKGGFEITLVASGKEFEIPYGTCKLNSEGHLSHIIEKPQYDFLINTGLYILNPNVLKLIPQNEFFHITSLIEKVTSKGMKVGLFPINDSSWIDIGQWAEYKSAIKKL